MADRGFLYYARGDKWIAEACRSAGSLKAAMPEARTAIVADRDLPPELFDLQIRPPAEMNVKQLKMWTMRQTPFEQTLFLDSDTWVADSLWEVFALLDRFQLAAALAPIWGVGLARAGGKEAEAGVSVAFPKLNTGVVAYRREPAVLALFDDWAKRHAEAGFGQDQNSFRVAVFASDLRFAVLPQAYNFRLPFPTGVKGRIKILHGRVRNIAALARRLNRSGQWRISSPCNRLVRRYYYLAELKRRSLWQRALRRLRGGGPAKAAPGGNEEEAG